MLITFNIIVHMYIYIYTYRQAAPKDFWAMRLVRCEGMDAWIGAPAHPQQQYLVCLDWIH